MLFTIDNRRVLWIPLQSPVGGRRDRPSWISGLQDHLLPFYLLLLLEVLINAGKGIFVTVPMVSISLIGSCFLLFLPFIFPGGQNFFLSVSLLLLDRWSLVLLLWTIIVDSVLYVIFIKLKDWFFYILSTKFS